MTDALGDRTDVSELAEPRPRPAGLRPFVKGDPRAIAAGKRGAAAARARREVQRAEAHDVARHLRSLVAHYDRADLGPIAAAAALDAIGRVQRGEWKVRDPADWVRVLVDVARLEAGQPTSASIVAHVGRDAAAAVLELRDQARAALELGPSSPVQAADDPGGDVDPEAVVHVHGDGG